MQRTTVVTTAHVHHLLALCADRQRWILAEDTLTGHVSVEPLTQTSRDRTRVIMTPEELENYLDVHTVSWAFPGWVGEWADQNGAGQAEVLDRFFPNELDPWWSECEGEIDDQQAAEVAERIERDRIRAAEALGVVA